MGWAALSFWSCNNVQASSGPGVLSADDKILGSWIPILCNSKIKSANCDHMGDSLGRFESSKVSLRSKIGFSLRVGKSSGSDLILCLSSCPSPPSLRWTAWSKGLWGYVSRPRTVVFTWALAGSSLELVSSLVWWTMIAGGGPAGCHLTERPNFTRCLVHPVIHILVDCGQFFSICMLVTLCVPASSGCKTTPKLWHLEGTWTFFSYPLL